MDKYKTLEPKKFLFAMYNKFFASKVLNLST
jgi:hypothetical protein